jgi:hypothetical protein
MEVKLAKNSLLVLVSLACATTLVGAINVGALDRLALHGSVERTTATMSIIVYWLLFIAVVWLTPIALRRRRETVLSIAATCATLGLVEIGLRVLAPGTTVISFQASGLSSRQFHHMFPANTRMYMGRFEGTHVFVDTNEDGLRTGYSKEAFKKYKHRVILLGDSFTFGLGVASEASLASHLEKNLRQGAGTDSLAVLNAGIGGYSPFLSKLLFAQRVAEYQPTVVLLVLDATDIGDDYTYMKRAENSTGMTSFPFADGTPPKYRGALRELIRPYERRLRAWFVYPLQVARAWGGQLSSANRSGDYYNFEIEIGGVGEKNRFFIYRHSLDVTRHLFDATMRNIDEIAHLAARTGAKFALAITPRFHHWNVKECPHNWERAEYRLDEPYQFEYFRYFDEARRGYPIINLLPDFQATDMYPLVFTDDPHWNNNGHAFVAETLAEHLLTSEMIQPPTSSAAASSFP